MVSCMATVKETNFEFFEQDDFRLRKPDIEITFQGELALDNMVDVIVRLTNPLPIPIHKGIFHIEGAGIDTPLLFKVGRTSELILKPIQITLFLFVNRFRKSQLAVRQHPHLNTDHHMPVREL